MTEKQQIFIREYLTSLNATEAAKRAGYSQHSAYSQGQRLLKDAEVQKALSAAMKARQDRVELSQDYVLNNLIEIVERSMQKKAVVKKGEQIQDENGNNIWTFDAKNAVRALELLGKHLGIFADRVQADIKADIPETLAKLVMEEYS